MSKKPFGQEFNDKFKKFMGKPLRLKSEEELKKLMDRRDLEGIYRAIVTIKHQMTDEYKTHLKENYLDVYEEDLNTSLFDKAVMLINRHKDAWGWDCSDFNDLRKFACRFDNGSRVALSAVKKPTPAALKTSSCGLWLN